MKKQVLTAGIAMCLLAGAQQAVALVPLSINYSGELVETTAGSETTMADKNALMYVRLYSSPSSTEVLWARSYSVTLNQGKFSIEISENGGSEINGSGARTSSLQAALRLQATDPSSEALYIGVRPLNDVPGMEIRPRQRVVSVPFAMLANDVTRARRNFTVTNGLVTVKNLTVQQNAVFSNKVTMTSAQGPQDVWFASAPRFVKGLTASQADKVINFNGDVTVTGTNTFSLLYATTVRSAAASTLNELGTWGPSLFSGGLTLLGQLWLYDTTVGTVTPSAGISMMQPGGLVTVTNLTAGNVGSAFPQVSIVDSADNVVELASGETFWLAPQDCFVLMSVNFTTNGVSGQKVAAAFYASPTSAGGGALLAQVGMGTAAGTQPYSAYRGATTASFFLKRGEYLTWQLGAGTTIGNPKFSYRRLTYNND